MTSKHSSNQDLVKYLYALLKDVQKKMFTLALEKRKSRKYVIHCSRRLGKTFLLCVLSCCVALSKPNAQIRYASVTQKAVKKMVHPIFKEIFSKVKASHRPRWNSQESAYIFSNSSMIHIAGVNNGHADDLRGTAADLCVVDEAGFVDELTYLVDSVLMPQLITTNGSLIMSSSSPLSPAHDFVDYIQEAIKNDCYSSFTIYDGAYSDETIEEFCRETKGKDSTAWRREYLNELIVDDEYSIIPEASGNVVIPKITPSENRIYFHNYQSMDIGIRDLTVVLFAYYDFPRAKLCIERELVINGPEMTTPLLAQKIKEIETTLWGVDKVYKRISDNNNLLLVQDLGLLHDCYFVPTNKDSLEAMVNEMRIWFKDNRIEISEHCPILRNSIKFGFWNDKRTDWGRSKTLGHFDAIASLMYLIRNLDVHTNPIPVKISFDDFVGVQENDHVLNQFFKL